MFHQSFYYSTLTLRSSRRLLQNVEHGDGEDKAKTNAEDKAQNLLNGLTVSLCEDLGDGYRSKRLVFTPCFVYAYKRKTTKCIEMLRNEARCTRAC